MSAWRATSASPVLPSFDFAATAAFYGRLGFSVARTYPDLLLMQSGQVELQFASVADPQTGVGQRVYLRGENVPAGAKEAEATLLHMDWVADEFRLVDPDGTLVRVGETLK